MWRRRRGGGRRLGSKLYNAVGLYLAGMVDGHLQAALEKYVVKNLEQHSPGVTAGRTGLMAAWAPLVESYGRRLVRPLRGFQDGRLVYLHTWASFGYRQREQVRMDIFATDADDYIVEHWGVVTSYRGVGRSGLTQMDGPTAPGDLDATDRNRDLVTAYTLDLLVGGDRSCRRHLDAGYVDHDPDAPYGPERHGCPDAGPELRRTRLHLVMAYGDLVATWCDATRGGSPEAVCDLYRARSGRLVEHWTVAQAHPSTLGQQGFAESGEYRGELPGDGHLGRVELSRDL